MDKDNQITEEVYASRFEKFYENHAILKITRRMKGEK